MRATLAFLNGAGSRRNLRAGSMDRRVLRLIHVLIAAGAPQPAYSPATPGKEARAHDAHGPGRASARGVQKFPR